MLLRPRDKVLIVHRRLFEKDSTRFFLGEVDEYENGLAKVSGFTFSQDLMTGHVHRKDDPRTKIIPIGSGTVLVYLLAADLQMDKLQFTHVGSELILADDNGFRMDLTERTSAPH
jgi:hypothetical protein